jgi:cytochrome o ubiquinol oxidase operon protein cyoD
MSTELTLKEIQTKWHGTLRSYLIGFFLSLLLTFLSFSLVITRLISGNLLVYAVIALALTQLITQLVFFLHLGQESKPRWETVAFLFMIVILLIIALGSIGVMLDLNARMMAEMPKEIS